MKVMDRHASINLHFPGLPIGKEISNRNGTSDEVIVFCCRSWRASSNGLIFLHRLRQFQAFGYQGRSDFKPQPKWRSRFFFFGKLSLDISTESNHFHLINFFNCLLPRTIFRFPLKIWEKAGFNCGLFTCFPPPRGGGGEVGFLYKKDGVLVISAIF